MSDAKVIFDYDAEADDELTLKEGDLIRNIEKKEDGWWEGELRGKRGMFPENFVEEIKKQAPETRRVDSVVNDKSAMARVTFDYDAENDDELTLKEGDMVKVLDHEEEGWWRGELNGKIGVFPSNFVELVKGMPPGSVDPPAIAETAREPEKQNNIEKKPKPVGGMGFGLTQDALSGIKLRKRDPGSNNDSNKKVETTSEPSELSKRLSMKRNPPKIPDTEKPGKTASKGKEKARVEFDYDQEQSDELTLRVGDVVTILEKEVNEGWSRGELNGKIGLFPDNFVKILPPEQPQKEPEMMKSKSSSDLPKRPPVPVNDEFESKPSRPDFPKLKKTPDRPPPTTPVNASELPVKLKPVGLPPENTKKSEPPPIPDSKPGSGDEKPKPPLKKAPPGLPKKPDKAKLPPDMPVNPERPPLVMRHVNGPNNDPSKRFSVAITPTEKPYDVNLKRHSQGAEIGVDFSDIKAGAVLQPLTVDRPKNPAKNPPTRYGKPQSPKKTSAPEVIPAEWPPKEEKEAKKPVEKPPKPALPEGAKPSKPSVKPPETNVDSNALKNLREEISSLKSSFESLAKQFKENAQKSDLQLKKMEKKFVDEIEELTRELDEEKKLRSAVEVEVNRLRKLIKNQTSS